MALNSRVERKTDIQCLKTGELDVESGDNKKNSWSAAISATSNQNGDQTGCEDRIMPEQEASERRRSGHTDTRNSNNSPLPGQRPAEQLPRRNFQIPRKIKERKGCALSVLFPTEAALCHNSSAACCKPAFPTG